MGSVGGLSCGIVILSLLTDGTGEAGALSLPCFPVSPFFFFERLLVRLRFDFSAAVVTGNMVAAGAASWGTTGGVLSCFGCLTIGGFCIAGMASTATGFGVDAVASFRGAIRLSISFSTSSRLREYKRRELSTI